MGHPGRHNPWVMTGGVKKRNPTEKRKYINMKAKKKPWQFVSKKGTELGRKGAVVLE